MRIIYLIFVTFLLHIIMSNTGAAIRAANQIILRLFDHRQFTSGEIAFHVRGIEKLQIDANFNKSLKINQDSCVIHDTSSNELTRLGDTSSVNDVLDRLNGVVERTEKLLASETEARLKDEKVLSEQRKVLEKKREQVLERTTLELNEFKESLIEEELELQRKYLRFEESLRKQPPR